MNTNNITIRIEKKEEYREVENLARESFWNVYRPGCVEHYVLNQLQEDSDFVAELDFVMEENGKRKWFSESEIIAKLMQMYQKLTK